MQINALGRTNLEVTKLSYGALEIRGPRIWNGRDFTDNEVGAILNAVLDAGINFIDTSYDYGVSEELIGKHIGHRRKEFYVATKCGCSVVSRGTYDDTPHVWTRENLRRNLESSLKRMKTDHIDIWQLHNPTVEEVLKDDLIDFMREIKYQGKVNYIGISTSVPYALEFMKWDCFDTFQVPYSALQRENENVIIELSERNIGTIIRGGIAQGEPGKSYRSIKERWNNWDRARLDDLKNRKESRTAFLLRFVLTDPHIHTVIVGTANPQHLREDLKAAQIGPLSEDIYEEAKRRLDKVGVKAYPVAAHAHGS